MEHNRIQKLLLSEYCDFSDKVLIESPFAETTRDGRGIRQVALGLTASKLVIAADILKKNPEFTCPAKLDPSIESFELVSIYPIELIALSIYCRRKRKTLKARLVDGRAKYYELGGTAEDRSVYWSSWMENVRELNGKKRREGSSLSETTAASSSSASTALYLLSSSSSSSSSGAAKRREYYRVWARYAGAAGDGHRTAPSSWRRKDIYLGPSYEQLSQRYYTPVPVRFAGASLDQVNRELLAEGSRRRTTRRGYRPSCSSRRAIIGKSVEWKNGMAAAAASCDVIFTRESERDGGASLAPKLSRFGFRIGENCASGLYLEPWEGDKPAHRVSRSRITVDYRRGLIESGVRVWEHDPGDGCKFRGKIIGANRHPRRYALATAAHFFHALGPWSVQPGERESVQRPRASSAVSVRRQPVDAELRLPVSKRQLAASVSITSLDPPGNKGGRWGGGSAASSSTRGTAGGRPVVLFWTPEYWYRPRAATAAYRQLRRHLGLIGEFRASKERPNKKQFFSKFGKTAGERPANLAEERSPPSRILGRIFAPKDEAGKTTRSGTRRSGRGRESVDKAADDEGVSSELRRLLRMDLRMTAWDLDSWTIARQLTLIDRELFLRIPWMEIEILFNEKSSRNAPNLGAWIAFAHRISCLGASEILATKKLDMRTRLLSRLINAAEKCHALGNFHSCRSILAGLESPAIYRLKTTWSRLRTRHSTGYETMERLCRIYRNTRSKIYEDAWEKCERSGAPCLPYAGHLLDRIIYPRRDQRPIVASSSSLVARRVSATIVEAAFRKIQLTNVAVAAKEEKSSLSKRIVSVAMSKMACYKSATPKSNAEMAAAARTGTGRDEQLAKKYYARWRLSILAKKILADREAEAAAAAAAASMDPKKFKVTTIVRWLYERQKNCQQYNFPRHSYAWEFLLKARYREEKDNFFASLRLEPPLG